ncbi:MAG: patatin-like phospholipase family protein [Campylobacterota bacterium]|nr:patatin-like phospholipase family protein [Campylobacterota bacterium]
MNKRFSKKLLSLFAIAALIQATAAEPPQTLSHKVLDPAVKPIDFSMVISGGVSLGAYEAGYNWAMIKMLSEIKTKNAHIDPQLQSVAGASAGSINALLSAVYWCQKESIPYQNSVEDNLFYETWVHLGIEDLAIEGEDPHNKSTLFTRKALRDKADKIMKHISKPIYKEGCEIPMGFAVTKVTPIVEEFDGIKIKNQTFSVPLTFKVSNGKAKIVNQEMPPSTAFYLTIPGIEKDYTKVTDVLFASSAFPGAFQQIKLRYGYKGKIYSQYFIDGGVYNNIPMQLATELDPDAKLFIYMDPSNMRKQPKIKAKEVKEEPPVGFLSANLSPLGSTVEIFQQMYLYSAINQYFRNNPERKLILSSRYHPLTAKYLEHFGAFLDLNFRLYDYYVGVYDGIWHLAKKLKNGGDFKDLSQTQLMERLMKHLKIDKNPEALTAYRFFLATEFKQTKPQMDNRYAAIYYAFNLKEPESKRYTTPEFTDFLGKLDMRYLPVKKGSFLAEARKDLKNWGKRPLRELVNRITSLENDRAKVYPDYKSTAKAVSIAAWGGSSLIKKKDGWDIFPLNAPRDEGQEGLQTALRLLPSEIATDTVNGGLSLGWSTYWYKDMGLLNGFEFKPSYNFNEHEGDFIRMDIDAFAEFDDFVKVGLGVSGFGNIERDFYDKDSAYGANIYVDVMDIFRITYVQRHGDIDDNEYFYLGIENIPSLIYWLNR